MSNEALTAEEIGEDTVGQWLAALGSGARRALISHLAHVAHDRQSTIGELAFAIGESRFTASRHVQLLREAGLVATEKRGNSVFVTLIVEPFRQIDDWLWSIVGAIEDETASEA